MYRQRYLVVEYHKDVAAQMGIGEDGLFKNHFPLHELLGSYHFQRLDDEHVIAVAEIPHNKAQYLESLHHVSVLPHNASTKHVHKAVKKDKHWYALHKSLKLEDAPVTMGDIIDDIEKVHGPCFGVLR